jgi:Ner family transcriptional regulator
MKTQPTKPPLDPRDWHPADVKAALNKAGWTLRSLGMAHSLGPNSLKVVLQMPWPNAERIIAQAIGVPPQLIWPSRYDPTGHPNRPRGRRRKVSHLRKHNSTSQGGEGWQNTRRI